MQKRADFLRPNNYSTLQNVKDPEEIPEIPRILKIKKVNNIDDGILLNTKG